MNSGQWNNLEYIKYLIKNWKDSDDYKQMLVADKYYADEHDILKRKRITYGANGEPYEIVDLPNYRIVDNIYQILVDQKSNYLFGKPCSVYSESPKYQKYLELLVDDDFRSMILDLAHDALNHGIAWLYPYLDESGEFKLYNFAGYEIIPVWKNDKKNELSFAIRAYSKSEFDPKTKTMVSKDFAEVYSPDGVARYERTDKEMKLISLTPAIKTITGNYNWTKCPLIPFRYFKKGKSLLSRVKSLQDALNSILSTFMNVNEEDPRSSLMVVMNYDGEDKESFKRELAQFGTVFLSTVDGVPGDVKTLAVDVNPENFKVIQKVIESRMYANGGGYDAKFDKLGTAPNEMNIQSMFSDIDLHSNTAATLFKASIKRLLWFYNQYLILRNYGDYTIEHVKITFYRDMLINTSQKIQDLAASSNIISLQTILENHPFVENAEVEMERIKAERKERLAEMDPYEGIFANIHAGNDIEAEAED